MALATMGFGGIFDGPGGQQILAVMNENAESLNRFKAAYGVQPPGTVTTLDNGVVGTWLADGTLRLDFVPQSVRDAAAYKLALRGGGGPVAPSNTAPFAPPPSYFVPPPSAPPVRSPLVVNGPPSSSSSAPAPAPAKIFGLPPLAVAGGVGLLAFLIIRRL